MQRFRLPAQVLAALVVLGLVVFAVVTIPSTLPADALQPRTADVANGQTMFDIGGCASCHQTPGQPDRTRLGGGLALKTMFGTFKVPNISSDHNAGIGSWSELHFANALVKGVGRNGEHLYPALPYTSYQHMALDDVRDLYAYMKTVPADATPSVPHQVPFPFNIRRALGGWKLLFVDGRPFVPVPGKDAAFNRGAYLVEGPGHCAECHSGRNLLGGIDPARRFAGGVNAEGNGWIPNITPHKDGLSDWQDKDLADFLKTGLTPDGATVDPEMGEVIANTSKLSDSDRAAMAVYIKSLPLRAGARPPKK